MVDTSATRLTCNGFEAWITADNKELKMYSPDDKGRAASCWIASQTDKEFSVHIRTNASVQYEWGYRVFLDGNLVKAKIVQKNSSKAEWVANYVRISQTEIRKFVFGPLELTDDDTLLESGTLSSTTGEIKVTIERGTARTKANRKKARGFSIPEAGKVHERSKKGLIHQVKYGKIHHGSPATYTTCSFEVQETLATVVFRYRPLEILQANGIVPYTAPHIPQTAAKQVTMRTSLDTRKSGKRKMVELKTEGDGEESYEDNDSDDDDIITMTQHLREELNKLEKKIAERKAGKRRKKIKAEAPERAPGLIHGEVIDLTL